MWETAEGHALGVAKSSQWEKDRMKKAEVNGEDYSTPKYLEQAGKETGGWGRGNSPSQGKEMCR